MDVEGMPDPVPPRYVSVDLDPWDLHHARNHARERLRFRNYAGHQQGSWKNGLLGDPLTPILVGLLGEIAVAKVINRRLGHQVAGVDFSLLHNGDSGSDLLGTPFPIQIKTRTKDYGTGLIRRADLQSGRTYAIYEHCAYVFAIWETGASRVLLPGWIHWVKLAAYPETPARQGNGHMNIEVPWANLSPFQSLVESIRARLG